MRCYSSKGGQAAMIAALIGLTAIPAFSQEPGTTSLQLPAVTGHYGVGTAIWHWIDSARTADAKGEMDEPRELVAQIWYPGETSEASSTRYRPLGSADFEFVRQNSFGAAPFAALPGKAPLIVLCPGRGTNRYYYTSIAEDLASECLLRGRKET